jgi:hypothetical protein
MVGEPDGWRSPMKPVRLAASAEVFVVPKSIAADPKYGVESSKHRTPLISTPLFTLGS